MCKSSTNLYVIWVLLREEARKWFNNTISHDPNIKYYSFLVLEQMSKLLVVSGSCSLFFLLSHFAC